MDILKSLTLYALGVLTIFSCTQFEDIGSDLVDDNQLEIETDTEVVYEMTTYLRDSIRSYARSGLESDYVPSAHILGQFDDPVFGITRYNLTAQVQFSQLGLDFTGATLDSAVLLLSYDTTFLPYGATGDMLTLDVFQLQSRELPEKVYVSDRFETEPDPIGTHTFLPSLKNQNRGDSLSAPSHIRIPMSAEFGQKILDMDTTVTASVLNFLDEFPGFVVKPREGALGGAYRFYAYATQSSGQTANTEISPYSGIRIYYTQEGESKEAYMVMNSSLHHFTTVAHEYEGSPVQSFISEPPADPGYVFLQPSGVGVRLDFNDLTAYQGKVINNVSLTWSVAEFPEDDTAIYTPMPSVFALGEDTPSVRRPVTDILIYQSSGAYLQYFGGLLDSGMGNAREYTFNITNEFQRIVSGASEPVVYIVPTPEDVSRIARSVIYGPGVEDAALKPQIKITYSSTNN